MLGCVIGIPAAVEATATIGELQQGVAHGSEAVSRLQTDMGLLNHRIEDMLHLQEQQQVRQSLLALRLQFQHNSTVAVLDSTRVVL